MPHPLINAVLSYFIIGQNASLGRLLSWLFKWYVPYVFMDMRLHFVPVVLDAGSRSWPAKYLGRLSRTLQPSQIEGDTGEWGAKDIK